MSAAPVLTPPLPEDMAAFAAYLIAARRLAPASVEVYVHDVERMLQALRAQGVFPDAATPGDFAAWDQELTARYQTATRLRHLCAGTAFYAWRRSVRACAHHPLRDLARPQIQRARPRPPSRDAAEALIEAVRAGSSDGPRNALMATLVYVLGLRSQEVTELRLPDLQLARDAGILRVRGTHARELVLDQATTEALAAYLATVRPAYCRPNAESVTDHLFLTSHGCGMTRQGFWKLLSRHAHRAGVKLNARALRRR